MQTPEFIDLTVAPVRARAFNSAGTSLPQVVDLTNVPSMPLSRINGRPSIRTNRGQLSVGRLTRPSVSSVSSEEGSPVQKIDKSNHSHKCSSPQKGEKAAITCPVCLDAYHMVQKEGRQLVVTTCGHIFCNTCLDASVTAHKTCPTCRKNLTKKGYHPIFI